MDIAFIALFITCAINLSLGALIFSRNVRGPAHFAFLLMSLAITLWTVANYATNQTYATLTPNDIFNRISFVSGYLIVLCGLIFTYHFPKARKFHLFDVTAISLVSAVVLVLSGTTYIAGNVSQVHGALNFSIGHDIWVYVLGFMFLIALITRNLLEFNRHADPQGRVQARFILFAFSVTAPLGLSINLIIPAASSNWQLTEFGPLITMILVITVSYAMIKHGLFDVRLVVARSAAYLASLALLAFIFGLLVFSAVSLLFELHTPLRAQMFISIATAMVALSFARIKRFFDRVTNRLFYRDAYDSQILFDRLNQILVSTSGLDPLLRRTSAVIVDAMMLDFCSFTVIDASRTIHNIGTKQLELTPAEREAIDVAIPHLSKTVSTIEDLPASQANLQRLLRGANVAVLVRLGPRSGHAAGYLLLGFKKSGNAYVREDLRALENMADELLIAVQNALHFEEIQHFNQTLQGKVEQATKELRRSNEKLKALDETKDEFITMASHQLRTPLTSVKGYLSMVLEGDAGKLNNQQQELLTQSYISAQRMVYLIADLLNLSRLNTGKFVIEPRPVSLSEVVQGEIDQLRETAKSRNISLSFDQPAQLPKLMLDETKIHQVVMNFIDNAIYYTPSGGHIQVALAETPTYVEYTVTDDGIGVPKTEQHKLFTKFYRAGNAKKARPDGTGLGLFMAKKVIAAQGGAIIFESVEGHGSTFGFRFSKAEHAAPVKPVEPALEPAQA